MTEITNEYLVKAEADALGQLINQINAFPFGEMNNAVSQMLVQGIVTQAVLNAFEQLLAPLLIDPDAMIKAKTLAFADAAKRLQGAAQLIPTIQVVKTNGRH